MAFLRLLNGLLDRLFIVVGAFLGSQAPAFMQQYTQRLAGHVAELNRIVYDMQQTALLTNKNLDQYIQKFIQSSDVDFIAQGKLMHNWVVRWKDLSEALHHLTHASIWSKPYIFLKEIKGDIAQSTFSDFSPSLSLSLEGLCYTGIGIFVGFIVYRMVAKIFYVSFMGGTYKNPKKV